MRTLRDIKNVKWQGSCYILLKGAAERNGRRQKPQKTLSMAEKVTALRPGTETRGRIKSFRACNLSAAEPVTHNK